MLCKHGAYVDLSVFRCDKNCYDSHEKGKIATKLKKNAFHLINMLMIIC